MGYVNSDSILLRGEGAPGANTSYSTGGNSNVDVVLNIDNDTVISLGNVNDKTSTITLKGVSDYSSVKIKSLDEPTTDTGSPKVDLSSGTTVATSAGEIFEYSVK